MKNVFTRLVTLLFITVPSFAFGQVMEATIQGEIVDPTTESPLEFATISVLAAHDSSIVTGAVTDFEGRFEIKTTVGSYLLKVDFIGYQTKWIDEVNPTNAFPVVKLGVIKVNSDAAVLQEIEVRAEKSDMQMAFDKKVFNVGKDLATTSSSAADLLDNIPSVTVDLEGNVSLRGSSGVRILVNGKPSGLIGFRGSEGLQSLPANLIERVEIITNPSARYEAEGMSGVLNIILKKERKKGVNGNFDLSGGIPDRFGFAANMNLRRDKFNLFGNYGYRWRNTPADDAKYTEFYSTDQTTIIDQVRDRKRKGWSHSFQLGSEIFLSPKDFLTGSILYRISEDDNYSNIRYFNYIDVFAPANLENINRREQFELEEEPSLEYSINYKHKFAEKDHELTAILQYQDSRETETANYLESFLDVNFQSTGAPNLLQRSLNDEGERSTLAQIDYVMPMGEEGQFEAGYRGSFRLIENQYLVEEFNDINWVRLDNLSNDFNYIEDINALYAIYSNKIGRFSYQIGLRGEHSHIRTELLQTDEINNRNYTNVFPSGYLNYELRTGNSIQLSYSKRIRRPRFWDLNPFLTFADSRNIYRGNPNLNPEFTDSYEVTYMQYWDKASLSTSAYYRYTTGVSQRIQTIEQNGNELITIRQPENLAEEDAYGFEFIFSADPVKWLRANTSINLFRSIIDGSNLEQNLSADAYSMFGRLNVRTTFAKKYQAQFRLFYEAPRRTTQGQTRALTTLDFGISRDILKDRGTLTFSLSDVFNSRKYRYENSGPTFYSEGFYRRRVRQAILTFNYRLNQDKKKGGRG